MSAGRSLVNVSVLRFTRLGTLLFLIAALAWTPFPLGSAVRWAPSVLSFLIGASCILWSAHVWALSESVGKDIRPILGPAILALLVLVWAVLQILPLMSGFEHPVWGMADQILKVTTAKIISINPWSTETHVIALATDAAAFFLAYSLSRNSRDASVLLNSVILISAIYALYTFGLEWLGAQQASLIYGFPLPASYISGPFMLHNTLATYCGLGALASGAKFFVSGNAVIGSRRTARELVSTSVAFAVGSGRALLLAVFLSFAAVVASASRAGFLSTVAALIAIGILSLFRLRRSRTQSIAGFGIFAILAPLVVLLVSTGGSLGTRLAQIADAGVTDDVRLALWRASFRMITVFPWTGLGLGTFQDAYPMFAVKVLPFVIDKAHCDYLEFAAGVGLPAAFAWWLSLSWLGFICLRGALLRRRNMLYPLVGFGASVLVALHSIVDFSLQIPAVSLVYAILLGIGVGQSQRTQNAG